MAFTKITTSDLNSRGATTLPNQPTISASALKQEFDAPAKEVVAPKFNNLIDELGATSAAANIGAVTPTGRTGNTVQTVINKISTDLATVESEIGEAIAEAHTHLNKDLLDTYTQTNENIAQAIADDHTHANKDLLDTYEQTEEDLAEAVVNTHSHDNKTVLDKFDEEDGQPTYDGNPIGAGDMYASDYDPDDTVKNAGGIVDYVDSQAYELPAATSNTLGGVMQGTNVSIDANGVISATDTTYSDATTSQSGLMSATDKTKLDGIEANANNYSLPIASTSQLGGVKVDGSTVTIDGNGVISSSGGGGGTTVVANPSGTATDDLEKLQVGTTIYEIPDTTYESKQAAQGGTDVSLVTTGEKYTWNEKVSKSATAGLLKNDGTVDQTQYVSDISGKADKVSTATNGNFAGLDSNGNLTDSGKKTSDFMASDGVTANPTGTATGTLTKLGIGSDIYDIQGGGGGIDGSTVTPTDVVATWLACAGLHQSYTTLNEVLADSGVLSALMESTNAVDYMVRSTTWASAICADETAMNYIGENNYCANVLLADSTWNTAICNSAYFEQVLNAKVPVMTSNTTPSGEVIYSSYFGSCYAYNVFNGIDGYGGGYWSPTRTQAGSTGAYIGYHFPYDVCINALIFTNDETLKNYNPKDCKVQYSSDGTNWVDIASITILKQGGSQKFVFANTIKASYIRLLINTYYYNYEIDFCELQFYGRSDLPPVDDRINAKADITAIATNEPNSTASKAYAIGEHFYKDGKFCTAKAAIASGAQFTLGTNYVEGTVADCMSKKDLLWTNPNIVISTSYNPNVTFAAQSLDAVTNLMDYDYFAIDVLLHTFRNYMNTVIIPNDVSTATGNWEMVNIISPSPSGNLLARRNIAFDGSTHKLTFSSGMYLPSYGGASTTDDNHFIVPYKIYGIKL